MSAEIKVLIGLSLVSLAGAAVFYITFLIAVDEVRKDIKRKRHGRRKRGAHHHWAGNSSSNRDRNRLSHGRSQKQTQVICVG